MEEKQKKKQIEEKEKKSAEGERGQRFLERRRVERVESRGMLSVLQEFSVFILQHRHLHILPYFIIIIFLTSLLFPFIQIVNLCYKFILRFSVLIFSQDC